MESNYEKLIELVNYLTETKGFRQGAIADSIGIDKTAFSHAVSGRRITKSAEYVTRIIERYKGELHGLGVDAPLSPAMTQKAAWDVGLEKMDEILRELYELKLLLKKE